MPPHFRVIKLRHRPRHPTQVKAHAVFRRRQIQFFRHDVYMHYRRKIVKRFFYKIFPALVSRKKHPKITPSRKPRCPSPSIRGTFLLFPFSTLLSRRLPCFAAYFRTSSIIFMLQKCGPHMEQKCAVFACGNVSSWNSRAVSGLATALAGCSCKTSGLLFFYTLVA